MHPAFPSGYILEPCTDLPRALDRIWKAGLMENEEETSRVLPLADPSRNPEREGLLHAWFVVDQASGKEVGMAILSPPVPDTCGRSELNLFVDDHHRGRGLGAALLQAALATDPEAVGYYSSSSVRLYVAHNLGSAWPAPMVDGKRLTPDTLAAHLGSDNLTDNQRVHVQWMLKDRAELDQIQARSRPRLAC